MANEYIRKIILEEIKKVLKENNESVPDAVKLIKETFSEWNRMKTTDTSSLLDWYKNWAGGVDQKTQIALAQGVDAAKLLPYLKNQKTNENIQYLGGLLQVVSELATLQYQASKPVREQYRRGGDETDNEMDKQYTDYSDYGSGRNKPKDIPGMEPGQDSTQNTRKRFQDNSDIPGAEPGQSQTPAGKMRNLPKTQAIMKLQKALRKLGAKIKIDGIAGTNTYAALQTAFPDLDNPKVIFNKLNIINKYTNFVSTKVTPEQYAANDKKLETDKFKPSRSGSESASPKPNQNLGNKKIEKKAEAPDLDLDKKKPGTENFYVK